MGILASTGSTLGAAVDVVVLGLALVVGAAVVDVDDVALVGWGLLLAGGAGVLAVHPASATAAASPAAYGIVTRLETVIGVP